MNLTRQQEGALGIALVVDLVAPALIVLSAMSRHMPGGVAPAFGAVVALAVLGLVKLADRQPGRLGLPEAVTGPKAMLFAAVLLGCIYAATSEVSATLLALTAVLHLCLLVLLVVLAVSAGESGVAGGAPWLWVVLMVFGGSIGMMVFWYVNIWRAHEVAGDSRLTSASSGTPEATLTGERPASADAQMR